MSLKGALNWNKKEWSTEVQAVRDTEEKKANAACLFPAVYFFQQSQLQDVCMEASEGAKNPISQHVAQNIRRDILNESHSFFVNHLSTFVLLQIFHTMTDIYRGSL